MQARPSKPPEKRKPIELELGATQVEALIEDSVLDAEISVLQAELRDAEMHVANLRAKLQKLTDSRDRTTA